MGRPNKIFDVKNTQEKGEDLYLSQSAVSSIVICISSVLTSFSFLFLFLPPRPSDCLLGGLVKLQQRLLHRDTEIKVRSCSI